MIFARSAIACLRSHAGVATAGTLIVLTGAIFIFRYTETDTRQQRKPTVTDMEFEEGIKSLASELSVILSAAKKETVSINLFTNDNNEEKRSNNLVQFVSNHLADLVC